MPSCQSCGAKIIWVEVAKTGKRMPIDPEPDPRGRVIIVQGRAEILTPEELQFAGGKQLYRAHRCPDRRR